MADELANRVRAAREAKGWTQAELAERIGVSRKTINTIENGIFIPTLCDLPGLTAALLRLADDSSLRARLGAAARARALARPTWEESGALFFETVREAVGSVPLPRFVVTR